MPRRFTELDNAHALLTEWAQWFERTLRGSAIGYPSRTAEARMADTGGVRRPGAWVSSPKPRSDRGAVIPQVDIPPRLREVDRAVRTLPDGLRVAVAAEFLTPGKGAAYASETGKSRGSFYRDLDLALAWVAGRTMA